MIFMLIINKIGTLSSYILDLKKLNLISNYVI